MTLARSFLFCCATVFMSLLLTACATQASAPTTAQKPMPPKRYLFLVSAGHAYIHKLPQDLYVVTLDVPAINQVVRFTDRPYREANFMSGKALQSLWSHSGPNNFATDHPNAVLSSRRLAPVIVEVFAVKTDADHISFVVRPIHQQMPTLHIMHKVTITIDSLLMPSVAMQPLNTTTIRSS